MVAFIFIPKRSPTLERSIIANGFKLIPNKGIYPDQFQFQPDEVRIRYIYHHIKRDDVTGGILEDRFVVIPKIRVCR
ncbi:MAG: hypothetical protein KME32_26530 [Mojavia pulchra JT2-VF2]|jgi:ATP-dependent DNA helicase RecQ|uniref:Uncharacterized protein n=1 Tax=Mojavia pulchra JT2-VF2 TaxID=287848 RepID=A0A951UIX5_9NOST|nr:hypothetical protein [Mojavia pulchra JT2-VF2]